MAIIIKNNLKVWTLEELANKWINNSFTREEKTRLFYLGKMPLVYSINESNIDNKDLYISYSTLSKCMRTETMYEHGHELSSAMMKELDKEIKNPLLVMYGGKPESKIAVTSIIDNVVKNNIMAIFNLNESAQGNPKKINVIISAYGRYNIAEYLSRNKNKFIAINKEKGYIFLNSVALYCRQSEYITYDESITKTLKNVNIPPGCNYVNENFINLLKGENNMDNVMTNEEIMEESVKAAEALAEEMKNSLNEDSEEEKDKKKLSPFEYYKQKSEEYDKKIADMFLKTLEEKALEWKKGWIGRNFNAVSGQTGKAYTGKNAFVLQLVADLNGYKDERFFTIAKLKEMGLKVKKGSKGIPIKKFGKNYKDEATGKWVTVKSAEDEAIWNKLYQNDPKKAKIFIKPSYVFSAHDVENLDLVIRESQTFKNDSVKGAENLIKISEGLGVPLNNDTNDSTFYDKQSDSIHLPSKDQFVSEDEYNFTALHELVHSTGSENRLNRKTLIDYSSNIETRAKEELVAEIGSAIMGKHIGYSQEKLPDINSHAAYVQSWMEAIKKDPKVFTEALDNATEATSYIEKNCGLTLEKESKFKDVANETVKDLEASEEKTKGMTEKNEALINDNLAKNSENEKEEKEETKDKDKAKDNGKEM